LLSGVSGVERFEHGGGTLVDEVFGSSTGRHMVFLHGWGGSRESLRGIGTLFQNDYLVHLIDLPGFGDAPVPPADWGTPNYTDLVQQYVTERLPGPIVLVGHSFGGRVSLRLAARHLPQLTALVVMAAPGLPVRGLSRVRIRRTAIRALRTVLRTLEPLTGSRPLEWHTRTFGSKDYLAAGALRPIFVRTVNEDLTESARAVSCPVLLLWGLDDTEAPPWLASRYQELMDGRATVELLPHKDHHLYTGTGAHLCAFKIRKWLERRADR
jgi:pimeloyl-ACP methyl ester carboxylesterase